MKNRETLLFTALVLLLILLLTCISCSNNDASMRSTPSLINTSTKIIKVTQTVKSIVETLTPTSTLTPLQQSIQEMYEVVDLIELYFQDNGEYPEAIENIIPEYLDELPYTSEGQEIWYRTHPILIYRVGFFYKDHEACSYHKSGDYYECGPFWESLD
jgi:hypothetical protein